MAQRCRFAPRPGTGEMVELDEGVLQCGGLLGLRIDNLDASVLPPLTPHVGERGHGLARRRPSGIVLRASDRGRTEPGEQTGPRARETKRFAAVLQRSVPSDG